MFENKYMSDDKMLKEYILKVICKKMLIICSIFIAIFIILLFLAYRESDAFGMGWYSSGVLVLLLTALVSPYFIYQSMKKVGKALNNNQTFETVVIFDDRIHMTEGSFSISIDYCQIKNIHILKYSCVLMFGENQAIMIKPNSFVNRSFDEFLVFINKKTGLSNFK